MNLTKNNLNYFNYNTSKKTKKGTIFINIARGETSPAEDLLKLLNEEYLGALVLDTYDNESSIAKKNQSKWIKIQGIRNNFKIISKRECNSNVP